MCYDYYPFKGGKKKKQRIKDHCEKVTICKPSEDTPEDTESEDSLIFLKIPELARWYL